MKQQFRLQPVKAKILMSRPSNWTNNTATPGNEIAEAEAPKTEQAQALATTQVADVMSPETIVVDSPPPQPDYPRYRVHPGEPMDLADVDPDASEHYTKKKDVEEELEYQRERLTNLQERLYAENKRSLLIVLQAMDTGGKDGTIKLPPADAAARNDYHLQPFALRRRVNRAREATGSRAGLAKAISHN